MNRHWSTAFRTKGNYRSFFNQIFQCELCLEAIDQDPFLCNKCFADLPFIETTCSQCSEPLATEGRCGQCQASPPAFDYSYCSFYYQHPFPHWLHKCKDKQDVRFAKRFANLMLQAQPIFSAIPDALVYIPTTKRRLFLRGFNLSREITYTLSKNLGIPVFEHTLIKTQHTEQRQLGAKTRRSKDTGLRSGNRHLTNQHLLIIDDVMTTGSTLHQAAKLLKQQGAQTVGAWCLARTIKHD